MARPPRPGFPGGGTAPCHLMPSVRTAHGPTTENRKNGQHRQQHFLSAGLTTWILQPQGSGARMLYVHARYKVVGGVLGRGLREAVARNKKDRSPNLGSPNESQERTKLTLIQMPFSYMLRRSFETGCLHAGTDEQGTAGRCGERRKVTLTGQSDSWTRPRPWHRRRGLDESAKSPSRP